MVLKNPSDVIFQKWHVAPSSGLFYIGTTIGLTKAGIEPELPGVNQCIDAIQEVKSF